MMSINQKEPGIPRCFGAIAGGIKENNNSWKSALTYKFQGLLQKFGAPKDQESSLHVVGRVSS